MMKRSTGACCAAAFLAVAVAGCGGGSSGSLGGSGNSGALSISLNGAVSLQTLNNVVAPTTPTAVTAFQRALGFDPPYTYRVVDGGSRTTLTGAEATAGASNLLMVDDNGDASLALTSPRHPIKVLYTVTSPDGRHVYVALDSGFWGRLAGTSSGDYSGFIAENNCALLRVSVPQAGEDSEVSCVAEGLLVQDIGGGIFFDGGLEIDRKPMQFDAAGNLYFSAMEFSRDCSSGTCRIGDLGLFFIGSIYKMAAADLSVAAITPDSDAVNGFMVLPSGKIAYYSNNIASSGRALKLYQDNGGTPSYVTLTEGSIEFFGVDDSTGVFYNAFNSSESEYRLSFVRPRPAGGAYKADLSLDLFKPLGSNGSPFAQRIFTNSADGSVYGVFEASAWVCSGAVDPLTGQQDCSYQTSFTVHRMLPYLPDASLVIAPTDPDDRDSIDVWGGTPFLMGNNLVFYVERLRNPIYFSYETIRIRSVTGGTDLTLFDGSTADFDAGRPRYEVFNWRLAGDTVYFSAMDQAQGTVYTGSIDTRRIADGDAAYLASLQATDPGDLRTVLNMRASASALGASTSVRDIEVLAAQAPVVDDGELPVVTASFLDPGNIYSASLLFSKPMDQNSVEARVTLLDDSAAEVPYQPVWIGRMLHLLPDLDGLETGDTEPLELSQPSIPDFATYELVVAPGASDVFGNVMADGGGSGGAVTMRPADGWYVEASDNPLDPTGNVITYAGLPTAAIGGNNMETFNLSQSAIDGPVTIEFDARGGNFQGLSFIAWHNGDFDVCEHITGGIDAHVTLGQGSVMIRYYKIPDPFVGCGYQTGWSYNSGLVQPVMTQEWRRFRIEFLNGTIKVYSSADATIDAADEVVLTDPIDPNISNSNSSSARSIDFATRTGLRILMRAGAGTSLDNLRITQGTNGTVRVQDDFDANTGLIPVFALGTARQDAGSANDYGLDDDIERAASDFFITNSGLPASDELQDWY